MIMYNNKACVSNSNWPTKNKTGTISIPALKKIFSQNLSVSFRFRTRLKILKTKNPPMRILTTIITSFFEMNSTIKSGFNSTITMKISIIIMSDRFVMRNMSPLFKLTEL